MQVSASANVSVKQTRTLTVISVSGRHVFASHHSRLLTERHRSRTSELCQPATSCLNWAPHRSARNKRDKSLSLGRRGRSAVSGPPATGSISRRRECLMNGRSAVQFSGEPPPPAAGIHPALNLDLNLHRLITHPAAQMEKAAASVCPVSVFLSGKLQRGKEALRGIRSCDVGSAGKQSGFRLSSRPETERSFQSKIHLNLHDFRHTLTSLPGFPKRTKSH